SSSASSSVTSRTRAAKRSARSAYSGSSASRKPYSFSVEPQPAAFATTTSKPSNVSIVRRANSLPSSRRPECTDSAPQQPWARGARGVLGIVRGQEAVLLQRRAAAGRVRDDDVEALERVDRPPRELLALLAPAGVHRQRAAAALGARRDDLAAVRRQHARGRGVDVAEEDALHAAEQQADACDSLTRRRRHLGKRFVRGPRRREVDERFEPLRQRQRSAERR